MVVYSEFNDYFTNLDLDDGLVRVSENYSSENLAQNKKL